MSDWVGKKPHNNMWEGAYYSALLSLFGAFVMIAGAYIDLSHHKDE